MDNFWGITEFNTSCFTAILFHPYFRQINCNVSKLPEFCRVYARQCWKTQQSITQCCSVLLLTYEAWSHIAVGLLFFFFFKSGCVGGGVYVCVCERQREWEKVKERAREREWLKQTAAAAESGLLIGNSINTYQIPEKLSTPADAPVSTPIRPNQWASRIIQHLDTSKQCNSKEPWACSCHDTEKNGQINNRYYFI